ncbi:MAG: GNAT family N-acetyltransferase [Anaerolineales bacterium]|nr:GNAT family N-acetyltransferase [Anaerolineales bacterium]
MLHRLDKKGFPNTRPLFAGLAETQPMCLAVLEGVYPGQVYADDPARPAAAYLQTSLGNEQEPQWGFLAGEPTSAAFHRDLNKALFEREIIHPDSPLVFCTCATPDWEPALRAIFAPSPPVPAPRRHYIARTLALDWRHVLPDGFVVEPLTASLLQSPGLSAPDDVRQTLAKWERLAGPRFADYGFVAIDLSPRVAQVAAWATVDFIAGGMGDLGVFTQDGYRRRGLACATSAAAIEHGLACGLRQVSWTCMDDNPGSIRTAERLGLERVEDYNMYVLAFDLLEAQSMLAYAHLQAGRHRQALALLDGIIASGQDFPPYVLFDAARARAILGEHAVALSHLQALAGRGSRNLALFEDCQEFVPLRDLCAWPAFLEKIRENARGG